MNIKDIIMKCQNCTLYKTQRPLLDNIRESDVMWLGLSAKKVDDLEINYPLENNTNSGKLIEEIENKLPKVKFYKSNLVKCLPLNNSDKIRYPTIDEMNSCIKNTLLEIEVVKPKIVFLLGNLVYEYVTKYVKKNKLDIKTKFVKINHPSYICVYKRKEKDKYVEDITRIIEEHCK